MPGCYVFRRMKAMWTKLKMRLPAVAMLAATLLFWGLYDRYEPAGPVLLESPGLSDAFSTKGDVSFSGGVFRLHVPEAGKTADVRFRPGNAADYDYIRLTGRIRTHDVEPGKHSWNNARMMLIQRRADGKWMPGHYQLHSETGTTGWADRISDFEIQAEAASAEVVLQQSGVSGTAWFGAVKAVPMKIKAASPWFRVLFAVLWLGLGVFYFRHCRRGRRKLRALILLNVLVILAGTLIPGEWISDSSRKAKDAFVELLREDRFQNNENPAAEPVPKQIEPENRLRFEQTRIGQLERLVGGSHMAGHFVLFASLCFLMCCSAALDGRFSSCYAEVAFDLLLFSAVSESLQHLTMDRNPGISDWLVDVYGITAAFILFLALRFTAHSFAAR